MGPTTLRDLDKKNKPEPPPQPKVEEEVKDPKKDTKKAAKLSKAEQ